MELNLTKPIAFFDIESTGINVAQDRIVELSIIKIHPNGEEETKTMRVNPTIPIPAQSTAIHGISDEDVKDEPTFVQLGKSIAQFIEGCDLGGYNSNKFDVPMLAEEFLRADIDFDMKKCRFIDVQVIFHKMEQRTLTAAYKFYCEKELDGAHSAEVDTRATIDVFKAQIQRYDQLENDIESLSKFSSHNKNVDFAGRIIYNEEGAEMFNFGKHKGRTVEEVLKREPAYFNWILNGDFPLYTKKVLTAIKLRAFNNQ